ncbi:MAG: 3-oxoacyl-ACP reductase FabG [Acidobacteriota bacterium]|nr:3-oxoacyl-ACP reductase FabG [Acidobacteriota bacterium]
MSENLPLELPKQLFQGKTVVITGASRGVGRATALRFAQAGANVAVNYLKSEQDAAEVVELCRRQGTEAVAVQGDAAKLENAEKIRQAAIETFGRIDILVINAGIWKGAPVDEMPEELWDEVLGTNLKSGWAMSRAIVPEIKKQERGAIVLVSSTAGQRGEANYSNYAASKGGQISFTKALAMELAPKIRVNCVAPGWIETAMVRPVFEDENYKQQVLDSIPLHRMASTDDIALAICFLASDWARHITGEILNINGGSVLCG